MKTAHAATCSAHRKSRTLAPRAADPVRSDLAALGVLCKMQNGIAARATPTGQCMEICHAREAPNMHDSEPMAGAKQPTRGVAKRTAVMTAIRNTASGVEHTQS